MICDLICNSFLISVNSSTDEDETIPKCPFESVSTSTPARSVEEEGKEGQEEVEQAINTGPAYSVSHLKPFFSKDNMNYTISDYSVMQDCRSECYYNSTIFTAILILILVFFTNICCLLKHGLKKREGKKVDITHSSIIIIKIIIIIKKYYFLKKKFIYS